jgi:hypothetical protein
VACGFSNPNTDFTFAPGLEGAIEPSDTLALPAGAASYYYVGADAGGNPLSNISWTETLPVTSAYSGNKSISIGYSTSNTGAFTSASTTNDAIASIGVTGYRLIGTYFASNRSDGLNLSLRFKTEDGSIVIVLYGGEGVGLVKQSGAALTALLDDTYSECGSNVIASTAAFGGELSAGSYTAAFNATTYPTNAGTAAGAVAYVLAPTGKAPLEADISLMQQLQGDLKQTGGVLYTSFGHVLRQLGTSSRPRDYSAQCREPYPTL